MCRHKVAFLILSFFVTAYASSESRIHQRQHWAMKMVSSYDNDLKMIRDLIKTVDELFKFYFDDVELFLNKTTEMSIVRRASNILPSDECSKDFIDLEAWKNKVRAKVHQLEEPLRKRVEYLKRGKKNNMKSVHMCNIMSNCNDLQPIAKRSINYVQCAKDEFQCTKSKKCISTNLVCDNQCHCSHCEDEDKACSKNCYGGFHCRLNLKCLDISKICNGIDDCGDLSDENGCSNNVSPDDCTIQSEKFLCKNGKCLNLKYVCNGIDDCGDESDEGGQCGYFDCSDDCSSGCFNTPKLPVCLQSCPDGTVDTQFGCLPEWNIQAMSMTELLKDIPRLAVRFVDGVEEAKTNAIEELAKSLSLVSMCTTKQYSLIKTVLSTYDDKAPISNPSYYV